MLKCTLLRCGTGIFNRFCIANLPKIMDLSCHKRLCTEGSVTNNSSGAKIGTHDGQFHCDEVLACFMLKQLPEFKNACIVRTRDEEILNTCDIVVDVGAVYDPSRHRYDHHQRTFNETINSLLPQKPWTIKLSSAGLVFVHFGQRIIAHLLQIEEDNEKAKIVFDKVYENFVQEIDAIDNGINICDGEPRYRISTNISSRVGHLLPAWNEPSSDEILNSRFHDAMKLVGSEFVDRVKYYGNSWLSGRDLVKTALEHRFEIDPSGEIIELNTMVPWKEHLLSIESELGIQPNVKFVIFTDTKGSWRVQTVPVAPHSFDSRIPLFNEWHGLRNEELSSKSGIADCIFVHATGFIGGNKNRDGVLEMARKTLKKVTLSEPVESTS